MLPVRIRIAVALVVIAAGLAGIWLWRARRVELAPVGKAPTAPAENARKEDAEPQSMCAAKEGSESRQFGPFRLVVERDANDVCVFHLFAGNGEQLATDDTALAISAQYVDLDRDRVPELVVVADSGGSGLHAESYVFTEKPKARLVTHYDGCATDVFDAGNGQRVLRTCHLGFNMIDGVCNGCSPRPWIFYALENGTLQKRNARFASEYDKSIRFEEDQLKELDVPAFVASTSDDDPDYSGSAVRWRVMRILADYIYSDRNAKAIEVAGKLWPAWDRDRILNDLGASVDVRATEAQR